MELLRIKNDLAFKLVFGRDEEKCKIALMNLLNAILSMDIKKIEYVNPINLSGPDEKETEFDIKAVLDDGNSKIDVEIQLRPHANFKERLVLYSSELMAGGLKNGEGYRSVKRCFLVAILDFNLFEDKDRYYKKFNFADKDSGLILSDILTIITLEMRKLKIKPVCQMTDIEKWLNYLKYAGEKGHEELIAEIVKESEAISVANEILYQVSTDEHVKDKILSRERYARRIATELDDARTEGRNEAMHDLILKLISTGKSIEEIANFLEIPQEKIKQIIE